MATPTLDQRYYAHQRAPSVPRPADVAHYKTDARLPDSDDIIADTLVLALNALIEDSCDDHVTFQLALTQYGLAPLSGQTALDAVAADPWLQQQLRAADAIVTQRRCVPLAAWRVVRQHLGRFESEVKFDR